MIIFINGSFGSGKTTVANLLVDKLPKALLFDPEEIGFMLRNILKPVEWTGDFQDYPLWRSLVPEIAKSLADQYGRTLVVPMTIWNEEYFAEVTAGLKAFDPDFHHFCLMAPLDIIRQRIENREEEDKDGWAYGQSQKWISSFESAMFDERIDSTKMRPEEIADHIISQIGK